MAPCTLTNSSPPTGRRRCSSTNARGASRGSTTRTTGLPNASCPTRRRRRCRRPDRTPASRRRRRLAVSGRLSRLAVGAAVRRQHDRQGFIQLLARSWVSSFTGMPGNWPPVPSENQPPLRPAVGLAAPLCVACRRAFRKSCSPPTLAARTRCPDVRPLR